MRVNPNQTSPVITNLLTIWWIKPTLSLNLFWKDFKVRQKCSFQGQVWEEWSAFNLRWDIPNFWVESFFLDRPFDKFVLLKSLKRLWAKWYLSFLLSQEFSIEVGMEQQDLTRKNLWLKIQWIILENTFQELQWEYLIIWVILAKTIIIWKLLTYCSRVEEINWSTRLLALIFKESLPARIRPL